jgi:hypothetical protein
VTPIVVPLFASPAASATGHAPVARDAAAQSPDLHEEAPPESSARLRVAPELALCDHVWHPVAGWFARYHCSACRAFGRKKRVIGAPRSPDRRARLGVSAYRCSAKDEHGRCRACAVAYVGDELRCPAHLRSGRERAAGALLATSALQDGAGTRVVAVQAVPAERSPATLFTAEPVECRPPSPRDVEPDEPDDADAAQGWPRERGERRDERPRPGRGPHISVPLSMTRKESPCPI